MRANKNLGLHYARAGNKNHPDLAKRELVPPVQSVQKYKINSLLQIVCQLQKELLNSGKAC